jgi:hypothetical protein
MSAYAETQLRIFVNHLTIRRVFIEIGGKKLFVLENFLHQISNLSSSRRARIGFENPVALGCERIERKTHDGLLYWNLNFL